MDDVYSMIQTKCIFQHNIDFSDIPLKGFWGLRVRSYSFCFGGFNKSFTEQGVFDEGIEGGIGACWAGMR